MELPIRHLSNSAAGAYVLLVSRVLVPVPHLHEGAGLMVEVACDFPFNALRAAEYELRMRKVRSSWTWYG